MIRLNLSTSARWITLLPGLRIHIAPITTAVMASARSDIAASDLPEGLPKEELAVFMAKAVARRVISDWEGVGDEEGVAVSVTPEGRPGIPHRSAHGDGTSASCRPRSPPRVPPRAACRR